jgi:hypothetical protein
MKMVILRTTHKRTKSNSLGTLTVAPSVGLFSNETDKTDNRPVTINYLNKYIIVLQIVNY